MNFQRNVFRLGAGLALLTLGACSAPVQSVESRADVTPRIDVASLLPAGVQRTRALGDRMTAVFFAGRTTEAKVVEALSPYCVDRGMLARLSEDRTRYKVDRLADGTPVILATMVMECHAA